MLFVSEALATLVFF